MYLHIGAEVEILTARLIGIFNFRSVINLEDFCPGGCEIVDISEGRPDSVVVLTSAGLKGRAQFCVYLSPISAATLFKRIQNVYS